MITTKTPRHQERLLILALCLGVLVVNSVLAGDLLPNGNFEKADPQDPRRPLHWDLPDGLGVQWVSAEGQEHGKAIRLDTRLSELRMNEQWIKMGMTNTWFVPNAAKNAIAETYGLSLYSDSVPIQKGQAYRISFDFNGASGGGKVFVRCYAEQQHRLYEKIVFCEKANTGWVHYAEVFFPTKFRPAVIEMRVMLFAYYPAGVYWFDNIAIDPISEEEYNREKKATAER